MFEDVKKVISEELGISPDLITPEADLIKDLGINSLDVLNLILSFEDKYGVEIEDEAVDTLATVGDLSRLIEKISS